LINSTLAWQALLPDETKLNQAFSPGQVSNEYCLASLQPRLLDALTQLDTYAEFPLLLIRCEERLSNLSVISKLAAERMTTHQPIQWSYRAIGRNQFQLQQLDSDETKANVYYADWIESDQLFGCLRSSEGILTPELGLLQQANGGTLILSMRTLLAQPLLWLRLKKFLTEKRFTWFSPDERQPLPIAMPDMPLSVSLILCGDRESLAQFSEFEPELHETAIYTEIEETLAIKSDSNLSDWAGWVKTIAFQTTLPEPDNGFLIRLYREATRYTGDQSRLPINPAWIELQLRSAYAQGQQLTAASLELAIKKRYWRESYLPEAMQNDIAATHSLLESRGEKVGQINGLSVLDLPGHPRPWGEPSRISCVVHYGDGEINDVERKAELSGNLHTKGMMIIEAWLIAELELEQQLPFSASMVFEQSYAEVDGDSASLAELAVLISALASKPIQQTIAVTGSVDQFGNVQPVGGLNEKIEGFYHLCCTQGLTGTQGVILPERNCSHLSLSDEVIEAIKAQQFFLWPVKTVEQALDLLMQLPWKTDRDEENLLEIIQDRIDQALQPNKDANRLFWPLRWLNWFKR
jgi:Lon-like ATP-dependent protease